MMKRKKKVGIILAMSFLLSIAGSVFVYGTKAITKIDGIIGLDITEKGEVIGAFSQNGRNNIVRFDKTGKLLYHMNQPREDNYEYITISDIACNYYGYAFYIKNYVDKSTGKINRQTLAMTDTQSMMVFESESEITNERYTYKDITVTQEGFCVMGYNQEENSINALNYMIKEGTNNSYILASEKKYTASNQDGIYQMMMCDDDVLAYITKTGKAFLTTSLSFQQVYPTKEQMESLSSDDETAQAPFWALFLGRFGTGSVYLMDAYAKDLKVVDVADKTVKTLAVSSQLASTVSGAFVSELLYITSPNKRASLKLINSHDGSNYEILIDILNSENESYIKDEEPVSSSISGYYVTSLKAGILSVFQIILADFASFFVISFALIFGTYFIFAKFGRGHRTAARISAILIPSMMLLLILLTCVSVDAYSASLRDNYEKRIRDEGNVMSAFLGAEAIGKIEYPSDYTDIDYNYIKEEMSKREMFRRITYCENDKFYVAFDDDMGCYMTGELLFDKKVLSVYREASATGTVQFYLRDDRFGRAMTAVTPIGSPVGNMVYMMETGIPEGVFDLEVDSFLRTFIIMDILFLLLTSIMVNLMLIKLLKPIHNIKDSIENYSPNSINALVQIDSRDEVSDLAGAYNRLIKGLDADFYNLKSLAQSYYRFVPAKIFSLLRKERVLDVQVGDGIPLENPVITVVLKNRLAFSGKEERDLISLKQLNKFWKAVNEAADQNNATVLVGDNKLTTLNIICTGSIDEALNTAYDIERIIVRENAELSRSKHLETFVFLCKPPSYLSICGDEKHLIPTLLMGDCMFALEKPDSSFEFSCGVIVDDTVILELENVDKYSYRFIGTTESGGQMRRLYDFYDSDRTEFVKMKDNSRAMLEKGLELFYNKRFYDAKTLFMGALKINPVDSVSRWYAFKCDELQGKSGEISKDFYFI